MAVARRISHARAYLPHRRALIAAAQAGRPLPTQMMRAARKSHVGKPLSPEHRAKISKALQGRNVKTERRPPWRKREDKLLLLPLDDIMKLTGRTRTEIITRRRQLRAPSGGILVPTGTRSRKRI
jgi:hypothetical protein